MRDLGNWYQKYMVDGKFTTNANYMHDEHFDKLATLLPKSLRGKNVMDLCCNAGLASFRLAKMGAKVWAFDSEERYIDQANYIMRKLGMPRVRFIISDVEKLLVSSYEPDLILALSCLYHLKDPEKTIGKLCLQDADILASFRLNNYNQYVEIFRRHGREVAAEVTYGRKRAVLLRSSKFGRVNRFVSFLSFSGCGHSLVSSLLDAHKNIIISREQKSLQRLYNQHYTKEQLFSAIAESSASYTIRGRPHKGSNTHHLVLDQYNGMAADTRVIGDKSGFDTVKSCQDTKFLEGVTKKLDMPIDFIKVTRNPFDQVAHMRKFCTQFPLRDIVRRVTARIELTENATKVAEDFGCRVFKVRLEDFVDDPGLWLNEMLMFLGLLPYEHYIQDCKRVVNPSLVNEKDDVEWNQDCKQMCSQI
jgi:SAM-dependent methyltransferase